MLIISNRVMWILISILLFIIFILCFVIYLSVLLNFIESNFNIEITYDEQRICNSICFCYPIFNIRRTRVETIVPVSPTEEHVEIEIISEHDYHQRTGNIIIRNPNNDISIGQS